MAERAIELLSLPPTSPPLHILDIGCGSGLSGEAITEAGHYWTGIDISPAMLAVALLRDVEGSLILHDIGQGLPFRPASFDGCISVSRSCSGCATQTTKTTSHAAASPPSSPHSSPALKRNAQSRPAVLPRDTHTAQPS